MPTDSGRGEPPPLMNTYKNGPNKRSSSFDETSSTAVRHAPKEKQTRGVPVQSAGGALTTSPHAVHTRGRSAPLPTPPSPLGSPAPRYTPPPPLTGREQWRAGAPGPGAPAARGAPPPPPPPPARPPTRPTRRTS
ncbi:hypothetical protein BU14_0255s0022 [Porphyra umbilicalis]|uniref:Uncharacterized protein n=1 Tax=Porphyra umbilicalis TaxID=2786 RepID=A0A1X6P2Y1_PORUM|nr:hypothetical protein BU14_0255s0022 [Porphyra umbilicalis]|eukprot:OSX75115.1 hypothetical protein BU14_0255s0022 [Porphyra umbilicalis]